MKQVAILSALLLAMPALANHGGPFRASLTGYEEVPPVSTTGDGEFEGRLAAGDQSVSYTLAYTGLSSAVTQAHIHFGQRSVNGPVVIWLCGSATNPGPTGTPVCPASGSVTGVFTADNVLASPATQQLAAGELAEFIAAMRAGAAYVNVHTVTSPGGEIRGQIRARGKSMPKQD